MARTPLPADTVFKSLNLRPENFAHLEEVAARLLRTPSDAMNSELEFLRTWGLSTSRLRRLRAAAADRKRPVREFVRDLVNDAGLQLPPARKHPRSPPPRAEGVHRTSMNISGPNAALVTAEAVEDGVSFNVVVNRLLEFAQDFSLHPDILAAIDQVASEEGDTRRMVIQRIIHAAVERLPPVPEEKQTRKR
jgi:hypothetical protein